MRPSLRGGAADPEHGAQERRGDSVFKSQNKTAAAKTAEFIQFTVTRTATLFLDMAIVWLLCDKLAVMRATIASCIASAVVIVLNYFASRFLVFARKRDGREKSEKES